jgi:metal-sulfur cluster biosynthetic enzyme
MISQEKLIEILKNYKDPEIGIDIWTLGLIYKIEIDHDYIKITMTFTTPFCPYGPHMIEELKKQIQDAGVKKVEIEVVFDPPWEPSEELKEMLGL